jgi:hypothetical protein
MLPPSAIIQKGGFSMTEHEKYQEHIRHTHDAFCKTVIRHAAIDALVKYLKPPAFDFNSPFLTP